MPSLKRPDRVGGAAFYLPGAGFALGLWIGLRWPPRATVLLAFLAGVVFLILYRLSTMSGDGDDPMLNDFFMRWVVAPAMLALWIGSGVGALLAHLSGGTPK